MADIFTKPIYFAYHSVTTFFVPADELIIVTSFIVSNMPAGTFNFSVFSTFAITVIVFLSSS
ncbi:MAG: hypothetical protein WAR59_14005 [Ignavibacteriaceae bacterium]